MHKAKSASLLFAPNQADAYISRSARFGQFQADGAVLNQQYRHALKLVSQGKAKALAEALLKLELEDREIVMGLLCAPAGSTPEEKKVVAQVIAQLVQPNKKTNEDTRFTQLYLLHALISDNHQDKALVRQLLNIAVSLPTSIALIERLEQTRKRYSMLELASKKTNFFRQAN